MNVPKPVKWATYPGDQRHMLYEAKGPTTLGEPVTVVEVIYDETSNQTRVGFTYALVDPSVKARLEYGRLHT